MASSKKITDLKALKKVIKKANEERKKEEEERKRAEKQSISDRDLFLKSIGDVTPIDNRDRVAPVFSSPKPIPVQRMEDEKRALMESLSDEFSVESLLETDDALSYARNGIGPDVVRKLRRGHWVIGDRSSRFSPGRGTRNAGGVFASCIHKGYPLRSHHSRKGARVGQSGTGFEKTRSQMAGSACGCCRVLSGQTGRWRFRCGCRAVKRELIGSGTLV